MVKRRVFRFFERDSVNVRALPESQKDLSLLPLSDQRRSRREEALAFPSEDK
jgi:hypothetical protein